MQLLCWCAACKGTIHQRQHIAQHTPVCVRSSVNPHIWSCIQLGFARRRDSLLRVSSGTSRREQIGGCVKAAHQDAQEGGPQVAIGLQQLSIQGCHTPTSIFTQACVHHSGWKVCQSAADVCHSDAVYKVQGKKKRRRTFQYGGGIEWSMHKDDHADLII